MSIELLSSQRKQRVQRNAKSSLSSYSSKYWRCAFLTQDVYLVVTMWALNPTYQDKLLLPRRFLHSWCTDFSWYVSCIVQSYLWIFVCVFFTGWVSFRLSRLPSVTPLFLLSVERLRRAVPRRFATWLMHSSFSIGISPYTVRLQRWLCVLASPSDNRVVYLNRKLSTERSHSISVPWRYKLSLSPFWLVAVPTCLWRSAVTAIRAV